MADRQADVVEMPNAALRRMAAGPAASLCDRMRDLATG
jgi:hypothetical protein